MKRGKRKGQITIFIIVAILLVAVIASFFLIQNNIFSSGGAKENIPDYVDGCLQDSLMEAIYFNALQGGYFVAIPDLYSLSPKHAVAYENLYIPVYWNLGNPEVPSLEDLQDQINLAVGFRMEDCLKNFTNFKKQGYEIKTDGIQNIEVITTEKETKVILDFPIFVTKADETNEYKEFSKSTDFNLVEKYEIVKKAIELQKLTPNDIPIVQFSELAFDKGFKFETIDLGDNTFLHSFTFTSEKNKYQGFDYTYVFAAKYNETE